MQTPIKNIDKQNCEAYGRVIPVQVTRIVICKCGWEHMPQKMLE